MNDHVHMLIAIPPKYAVSQVVGFIKGEKGLCRATLLGTRVLRVYRRTSRGG